MSKTRTRKDSYGRVWEYSGDESTWHHGEFLIGCGADNGSKFSNWNEKWPEEHKTLKLAMDACQVRSVTVTWANLTFSDDGIPSVSTCQRVTTPVAAAVALRADTGGSWGVFVTDQWRGFSVAADRAKAKMIARIWGVRK